MKVLLTGGKTGQLRWELMRSVSDGVDLIALDRQQLDVTNKDAVMHAVATHRPDILINAAAYTAVDKAETDRDTAFLVNCDAVKYMAEAAKQHDAFMIHVSTDFVFDGESPYPYLPDSKTDPIGVYGESKLAGEKHLQDILAGQSAIIRTAWVYSSRGGNFVKTMLRLMSERDEIGVIADQVGTPTWANGLAKAIWCIADKKSSGTFHWTDAGAISWYDFAYAIYEEGKALDLLNKNVYIRPLRTDQYPTPAKRPACGVLEKTTTWDTLDLMSDHWRVSLRKMMQELL